MPSSRSSRTRVAACTRTRTTSVVRLGESLRCAAEGLWRVRASIPLAPIARDAVDALTCLIAFWRDLVEPFQITPSLSAAGSVVRASFSRTRRIFDAVCYTAASAGGSEGSHRASLPDDYHFEPPVRGRRQRSRRLRRSCRAIGQQGEGALRKPNPYPSRPEHILRVYASALAP
jgi:hypothetical protein